MVQALLWPTLLVLCDLVPSTRQHGDVGEMSGFNGCYKGDEGEFFWTTSGETLQMSISADMTEDEWVALAFSNDTLMGNDDVVAVYKNYTTHSFTAVSLLDPGHYHSTIFQAVDSITESTVTYDQGRVHANISKNISISYPYTNLHHTPVYLFFGRGKIRTDRPSKPLHKHHQNPSCSPAPVALYLKTRSGECMSPTHLLFKVHGILMILVWLNLTPLLIFIARYGKDLFEVPSLWFTTHKWSGILAGLVVIIAIVLAWVAMGEIEFGLHQSLGWAILLILFVHVLFGLFRPSHEHRFRKVWEVIHRIAASLLFGFSVYNIIGGLEMIEASFGCYYGIGVQLAVHILIVIALENSETVGSYVRRSCQCFKCWPNIYYILNLETDASRRGIVKAGFVSLVLVNLIAGIAISVDVALAF